MIASALKSPEYETQVPKAVGKLLRSNVLSSSLYNLAVHAMMLSSRANMNATLDVFVAMLEHDLLPSITTINAVIVRLCQPNSSSNSPVWRWTDPCPSPLMWQELGTDEYMRQRARAAASIFRSLQHRSPTVSSDAHFALLHASAMLVDPTLARDVMHSLACTSRPLKATLDAHVSLANVLRLAGDVPAAVANIDAFHRLKLRAAADMAPNNRHLEMMLTAHLMGTHLNAHQAEAAVACGTSFLTTHLNSVINTTPVSAMMTLALAAQGHAEECLQHFKIVMSSAHHPEIRALATIIIQTLLLRADVKAAASIYEALSAHDGVPYPAKLFRDVAQGILGEGSSTVAGGPAYLETFKSMFERFLADGRNDRLLSDDGTSPCSSALSPRLALRAIATLAQHGAMDRLDAVTCQPELLDHDDADLSVLAAHALQVRMLTPHAIGQICAILRAQAVTLNSNMAYQVMRHLRRHEHVTLSQTEQSDIAHVLAAAVSEDGMDEVGCGPAVLAEVRREIARRNAHAASSELAQFLLKAFRT